MEELQAKPPNHILRLPAIAARPGEGRALPRTPEILRHLKRSGMQTALFVERCPTHVSLFISRAATLLLVLLFSYC